MPYRLNTKIHLTFLCSSGFELYSRWVLVRNRKQWLRYAKFLGVNKMHYVLCENDDYS